MNFLEPEENGFDQNGHGTLCAGLIAGSTYGVAKKASIVSVKILNKDGGGTVQVAVSAIQWIKAAALASNRPCIVNIAFSAGGASKFLDEALDDLITNAGCLVVAAAGNRGQDACQSSPGRISSALTVGATQQKDEVLTYSNWGTCVKCEIIR
ncbi:peptidase S8/S53 domain-containing protein [Chytridium lagenaria]|nr:peptidase S8/S53 domain-containing protein [Chytridium lagenaria]